MASFIERDECCLFIGNLDSRVTEEILWELFLQAAPLNAVHIPKDKDTGRNKGFGFVRLSEVASVPYTINLLNGTTLFDKSINVAQGQENTSSPLTQSPSNSGYGVSPLRMTPFDNQNGQFNMHSRTGNHSPSNYGCGMSDLSPLSRQMLFHNRNRPIITQSSPVPLMPSPPVRSEIDNNSMNFYPRPRNPWDMMSPWTHNARGNQNLGWSGSQSSPSLGPAYNQGPPNVQGRWRR